jgi:hypothetical protein
MTKRVTFVLLVVFLLAVLAVEVTAGTISEFLSDRNEVAQVEGDGGYVDPGEELPPIDSP